MGKRKSSKKPQGPKRKEVLATAFQCLFCHHEGSVTCKLDRKEAIGHLNCRICGKSYQCPIHHLSEPIDVYSEWIDATEEANAEERVPSRRRAAMSDDES